MRFLSSVALLSLAGLGLAAPTVEANVASNDLVAEAATDAVRARGVEATVELSDGDSANVGVVKARGDTNAKAGWAHGRHGHCLHPHDAQTLVDAYVRMITKWDVADAKYLAESFRDTSDSINQLAGKPLGSDTFPTKQSFIDKQNTQPDLLPIQITHQGPVDCDEVAVIWTVTFGVAQKPVRGVTIIGATKEAGFWQIKSIDVEFNNIAYLLNIGGSYKMPGQA